MDESKEIKINGYTVEFVLPPGLVFGNFKTIKIPAPIYELPRILKVRDWLNNQKYDEFKPSDVIESRYAEKTINYNFYGPIKLDNISLE